MNNGKYLIPANSKRSLLIFGLFNKFDLILFGSGVITTLILMSLVQSVDSWVILMLVVSPALITGLLVFPLLHYHNVLTLLISVWTFYTTRQRFIWKGWCVKDEFKEENSKN